MSPLFPLLAPVALTTIMQTPASDKIMATADVDIYISGKVASGEVRSEDEFLREAAQVYRELEERHTELWATI